MPRLERRRGRRHCRRGALWEAPHAGKRSAAPALPGPGTRLGRPSVATIPAPACHQPSVAGEAGPEPRGPFGLGLGGEQFEKDQN